MNRNSLTIFFVLDHELKKYRIPFFQELSERGFEISVGHTGEKIEGITSFDQIILNNRKFSFGEYRKIPHLKNYDVVIHMQNIRILNLWFISLNPFRGYKLIHWGIGVSSAKGLQKKRDIISKIRNFLSIFSDALVFYSDYPLNFLSRTNRNKSFIAHNTIFNSKAIDTSKMEKDSFLFIGSINERKGIDILLSSYKRYLENGGTIAKLNIVGSGEESLIEKFKKYVAENGISKNIFFRGPTYKDSDKYILFSKALVSISPKQAGLSVLESFSYGVPFICFEDAISGGEHLNVKNGFNGFFVNSAEELTEKMNMLSIDNKKAQIMGENAFNFYKEERSMKHMADGFSKAIGYVINK